MTLPELARRVGASPFHLARVFREETGLPIHRYLVHLRLALAWDRLLDGDESLSTIAHAVGFSSHSHFSTVFRRVFARSPSSLRRGSPGRMRELGKNLKAERRVPMSQMLAGRSAR
jgi:AraC-like DNA-binding protein